MERVRLAPWPRPLLVINGPTATALGLDVLAPASADIFALIRTVHHSNDYIYYYNIIVTK
jgi:hypothetical protein